MRGEQNRKLMEFSFSSRLAAGQSGPVLMRLARQIWSDNVRAGLTGFMRRDGAEVDQIVEGPRHLILPLAAGILGDERHFAIAVRAFGPIERRGFGSWTVEGFDHAAAQRFLGASARSQGCVVPLFRPAVPCEGAPRPALAF